MLNVSHRPCLAAGRTHISLHFCWPAARARGARWHALFRALIRKEICYRDRKTPAPGTVHVLRKFRSIYTDLKQFVCAVSCCTAQHWFMLLSGQDIQPGGKSPIHFPSWANQWGWASLRWLRPWPSAPLQPLAGYAVQTAATAVFLLAQLASVRLA